MAGYGDCRHPFRKGNKKKEGKRMQGAPSPSQAKNVRADQASAECFYCKKQGHWKRNCPLSHASLDANRPRKRNQQSAGQGIYMIKPCSFSVCDIVDWVLDTSGPIHIYNGCKDCKSAEGSRMGIASERREWKSCFSIGDRSS